MDMASDVDDPQKTKRYVNNARLRAKKYSMLQGRSKRGKLGMWAKQYFALCLPQSSFFSVLKQSLWRTDVRQLCCSAIR